MPTHAPKIGDLGVKVAKVVDTKMQYRGIDTL